MRLFSYKNRPVHLGPYPLEELARIEGFADLSGTPSMPVLNFRRDTRENLANAMGPYAAMLDLIRDGFVKKEKGVLPQDHLERANHLKAFAYYQDASQVGVCELSSDCFLKEPRRNPYIKLLEKDYFNKQSKTFAAGIDVVLEELTATLTAPQKNISDHTHALIFLYEYPRDPEPNEVGAEWIEEIQAERASIRAAETGTVLANYIRLLGYEACSHTLTHTDVDLNKLIVACGLGEIVEDENKNTRLEVPFLGADYGVGVITTTFALSRDKPLKPKALRTWNEKFKSHSPRWCVGKGFTKNQFSAKPYENRLFRDGAYPFERIKRVGEPTTFIDEPRVPRVPKRADMFARAIFGDMGQPVQEAAKNGNYIRKNPASFGARRPLAAFVVMQDGQVAPTITPTAQNRQRNADNIKASLYFLGADAVGISRCPDWVYYSHDSLGNPINAYHENAISVIIDQGHETMEGASGDDWIACSQSMRAYLRFSLLGGIIAEQIRRLGYSARTHTVMDGEVLQPPLLLLSGLGEVSRIGEVILNPFLGPRLKSGVITTNMPVTFDQPIDFGLQNFCNNCNKCARECPSGAITAGPKTMFNGYEIWKSDSQKCTTYRVSNQQGAMCGRCMKTCPWNLEGLFVEAPFRWMASNMPSTAKVLAKLDDKLGRGKINPIKKWWWDLEMIDDGPYTLTEKEVNARDLHTDLELKFDDQTLAVYPAHLAPPPYPYPYPMDREEGIEAYKAMLSPEEYKDKLSKNLIKDLPGINQSATLDEPPVIQTEISKVFRATDKINIYELKAVNDTILSTVRAGAHIDVVVAPEFLRQYSLAGDPADSSKYTIAVLREGAGRGGSDLLHRIFYPGRRVFISQPINHFSLDAQAKKVFLMAGGIGVTPMIAMAYELHRESRDFEFHYSVKSKSDAAFLDDIRRAAWADKVQLHISDQGDRADLKHILKHFKNDWHIYTCGPDNYMQAVFNAAAESGWSEDNLHREYFSAPETANYTNYDFTLKLQKTCQEVKVSKEETAVEALARNDIHIPVKCSDGICGVCKCDYLSGEVEHRDHVLSKAQRENTMILCQSRATEKDGIITLDI